MVERRSDYLEDDEADYRGMLDDLKRKYSVEMKDDNQPELIDLLKDLLASVENFSADLGLKVNLVEQLTRDLVRVSDNKVLIPVEEGKLDKMAETIAEAKEILERGKNER